MKKLTFICVFFILVQIFANNEAFKLKNLRKNSVLSRVKRDWAYNPVRVYEWIPVKIGQEFEPYQLLTIKSDAPNVEKYELAGPGIVSGVFSLHNLDGVWSIWLDIPLDYEAKEVYKITASAFDKKGKPLETPTVITIDVIDLNDNKPKFDQDTLEGIVYENATAGSKVQNIDMTGRMQIVAEDLDSKDQGNGVVRYSYGNHETPSGTRFSVSQSGLVSVVGNLDSDKAPQITFTVLAKDGSETTGIGHTVNATVRITVLDSNNHKPQFLGAPYATSKGELLDIGSTVFTVRATDLDVGENNAVYFKITAGNTQQTFDIKSNPNAGGESTGQIILAKKLDYELGPRNYKLKIQAYNKEAGNAADSNFYSFETVEIDITDENEAPIFQNTPYSGRVTENRPDFNKPVATVLAIDPDFGGQSVTYSIMSTQGWFSVDPVTGVVMNIAAVDRENPAVNQETSVYDLMVRATDDYEPEEYDHVIVSVNIVDLNDNPPGPLGGSWNAQICEKPLSTNVTIITAVDPDIDNGPPFTMKIIENEEFPNEGRWMLETLNDVSAEISTLQTQFNLNQKQKYLVPISIVDTPQRSNEPSLTGTGTLTVNICHCNSEGVMDCTTSGTVAGAGFPVAVIIGIIAAILILLIIVLAVVAYRRNRDAELQKIPILLDDDDVRENLQAYHDEGGGEEDNDGYDISALQNPPLLDPKRQDEPPLTSAQPQPRSRIPPNTDIGDYINDAKGQADNDPTAPPFDSLLVFDYEGAGSDAGSLSSLNSGTTDGSQDYDHLNNWGPRFKKLADMYGGGESD